MDKPASIPKAYTGRKGREWRRLENAMRALHASARERLAHGSLRGTCVLIVDDDPSTRLLYSINLELEGFHVLEAADGRRALAIARAEHPDFVLTDVMMPGLDGFELAEALGRDELTSRIPVVFLTGETTAGNEARAHALGAVAYLTKPLDFHALVGVMTRARPGVRLKLGRSLEGDAPTAA